MRPLNSAKIRRFFAFIQDNSNKCIQMRDKMTEVSENPSTQVRAAAFTAFGGSDRRLN